MIPSLKTSVGDSTLLSISVSRDALCYLWMTCCCGVKISGEVAKVSLVEVRERLMNQSREYLRIIGFGCSAVANDLETVIIQDG